MIQGPIYPGMLNMKNSKNNQFDPRPPTGVHVAIAAGHTSTIIYNGIKYIYTFSKGVKGFNIPDIITIHNDGSVVSKVLGE